MSDAAGQDAKPDDAKPDDAKADDAKLNAQEGAGPDAEKHAGTSLAPAVDAPSGIDPFLAKAADASEPAAPRPLYAKALDYSAHAAMIVGLIGFAWTVSDHVTSRPPAAGATATPVKAADASGTATPKSADTKSADTEAHGKVDELGDLRKTNQKMAAEIRGLHASLEALRTTVVRERSSGDDVRSLSAAVDQVKAGLAAARSEQTTQMAQLTGKVDKLQRDARQQAERVAHAESTRSEASRAEARAPERQQVDTTATASIPAPAAKAVPTPPAKPTVLASIESETGRGETGRAQPAKDQAKDQAAGEDGKPQVISGWVVRDVYQGVALIEGRRGSMEVVPGVSIPGAGVVRSIDRHGGGWTVTTTKGQLAFAAQHEQHRGGYRDYYGPRRYDF